MAFPCSLSKLHKNGICLRSLSPRRVYMSWFREIGVFGFTLSLNWVGKLSISSCQNKRFFVVPCVWHEVIDIGWIYDRFLTLFFYSKKFKFIPHDPSPCAYHGIKTVSFFSDPCSKGWRISTCKAKSLTFLELSVMWRLKRRWWRKSLQAEHNHNCLKWQRLFVLANGPLWKIFLASWTSFCCRFKINCARGDSRALSCTAIEIICFIFFWYSALGVSEISMFMLLSWMGKF